MAKAYSYIRFSTPEQARGDSLRRQSAAADEWCKLRNIQLDDTLRDMGVSAFRGVNRNEGALRRFLELVQNGRIERGSYLIVESLDRISRDVVDEAAFQLLALIRAGIIVVTLSDGQEYSEERLKTDWTPLIVSVVIMARAHEESLIKSQRLTAAWAQKKALARSDKKPLTPRCPEWLEVHDGKFHTRPDRVDIVQRIFKETIEGYGRREIVRRLNIDKIPTFRGGDGWHTSSVAKVIQSRATIGEYQPHSGTHKQGNRKPEGDPIKDYYPPIIEEAVFWRAQSATEGRRQKSAGRKGPHAHLLQGLAVCHECGSPMHLLNKGKPPKGGKYIACSSNLRGAGCSMSRRWRSEIIEDQLLCTFAVIDSASIQALDNTAISIEHDVSSKQSQLDDAKQRQKRLVALVEAGDETATTRSLELTKEIKRLSAELKIAKTELSKSKADPDFVQRIIEATTLSAQLEDTDQNKARDLRIRLREIIKSTIDQIVCDPEIGVILHFPLRHSFDLQSTNYRINMKAVDGSGPIFLLDKDPTEDVLNRFFGEPFSSFENVGSQEYTVQDFDTDNPTNELDAFAAAFLKFKQDRKRTPSEIEEWVHVYHQK